MRMVQMREQAIGGKNGAQPGLMRGLEFANTFSFLRPNDLVWNYVVDNYLKGRTPVPFDLLYWNSDSTSLPGPMYVWYLRNTYLENSLREPGKLTVCGEAVDLSRIDVPHLHLRLARRPYRAVANGLCIGAVADGTAEVRARRIGAYRGRPSIRRRRTSAATGR